MPAMPRLLGEEDQCNSVCVQRVPTQQPESVVYLGLHLFSFCTIKKIPFLSTATVMFVGLSQQSAGFPAKHVDIEVGLTGSCSSDSHERICKGNQRAN